ncbi:peroxisomal succinyl-coenzyme A thioesterase-like [Neosynchiropus ocellatus]
MGPGSVPDGTQMGPGSVPDGTQMGPGSVSDGTQMGPGSVPDGTQMGPRSVLDGTQMGPGSVSDGTQMGPGSVPDGTQMGPGSVPDGTQMGPGSVSDGTQMGPGSVPDGTQMGPGSVPDITRFCHCDPHLFRIRFIRWHSGRSPAPILSASPARALVDEAVGIRAEFLPPHRPVTMRSRLRSEDGDLWEAFAHYNSTSRGAVDVARAHSVGGSYLGCEPMGLFWALQPAPGSREGIRLRKKDVQTPYVVDISLLEGHVTPTEAQSVELAAASTERSYMAPGVRRVEVREKGVVGTLFLPPGPGRFPAMLDLWGMGGGLHEYRSALLASRGYASLSLAYFGHSDLPGPRDSINVDDAYFKAAFGLLQDHPQVCSDRVGIIGLSFGVYLMLRLAIQIGVKTSCLIGINGPIGSAVQLPETAGGTRIGSDQTHWSFDEEGYASFRDMSSPANMLPHRRVKVEDLQCPLMYIVGEDDLSASSAENAALIDETLRAAGKSHLFTCLSYPGAGHLIEPPYTPNTRVSLWRVKPQKLFSQWGGQPKRHAAAQGDSWRRILDFMEKHLRR